MAMNTTTFAKTIGLTEYHDPMMIAFKKRTWDWPKLFTMGKMENQQWQTYQYTGFGAAELSDELSPVTFEQAYELDPITITAVKYVKGFMVSEELEDDNRQIKGLLNNWAKSVGRAQRYVQDLCASSVYENAFSSSFAGWDDIELCGAHTTTSGQSIDNDLGPSSLAHDSLWDMRKYFSYQIYDEQGLLMPMPDAEIYLVTHPANADTVEEILKSSGKVGTADNDINTLKGFVTPVYNPHLTSTTAYFLQAKQQADHLRFMQRKEVSTKWKDAFENIGRKCRTHQRFGYGFTDYRFIVGNPGA